MRRISMVASLCVLASLLVGGPVTTGAPALASTDTPFRVTIEGIVTDATSGDPVAGACISLYRLISPSGSKRSHRMAYACTDTAGAYSLPNIPINYPHAAFIEAPGYGEQWYGGRVDLPTVVNFSGTTSPITTRNIALKPATAGLSVHLTRQDGSPSAYATVQVMASATLPAIAQLRTDANGDATRTGLPAGDYRVEFINTGYAAQWYPGRSAYADGLAVTLAPGQTTSIADQLVAVDPMPSPPALSTASGTVRAKDGTPIAGATVAALATNSAIVYGTATTGADGGYTIATLPNSTGLLRASAPGYTTVWNSDDPLPAASVALPGTHDFVLPQGSGTIRGTLTDSVDGPVPVYTAFTLNGSDGWTYGPGYAGYDGTYEILNAPPGTYSLTLNPTGRPAQTISNVVVRDGQVTTTDARLLDPGRLRVRVVDDVTGQPVAGASVSAYSYPYNKVFVTDAQGYAEFGDFWSAVTVQVQASHSPYHFQPNYVNLTVAPGGITPLTIRMKPGAVLAVPVTNLSETLYPICADLLGPNPLDQWIVVNCEVPKDGVVTFGPLDPGTFRAFLRSSAPTAVGAQWLSAGGGTGEERSATLLTLTAGSTTTTPVQRFGPAGSIAGKIIDPKTRQPVIGCIQFASRGPSWNNPMGGCSDDKGVYRIDGLGPYSWPLYFESRSGEPHGNAWAGGATSRLDTRLVTVAGNTTQTQDFAPGAATWFDVRLPAGASNWLLWTHDARTGDPAGYMLPSWSSVGAGPKLLVVAYNDAAGAGKTCWMRHDARLRLGSPANGVYYGGTQQHPTVVQVLPGKNCVATVPPFVNGPPVTGSITPLNPGRPAVQRQAVSVNGIRGIAFVRSTEPETFNQLVRNNFEAALQLAIGVLP